MATGLDALGVAVNVIQLAGNLCQGLRMLKDSVRAVKEARLTISHLEDKVDRIKEHFQHIERYLNTRPMTVPNESDLHHLIQKLTKSCYATLSALSAHLPKPKGSGRKIVLAFNLWIEDQSIKQKIRLVEGHVQDLSLLVSALNLYKLDNVALKVNQVDSTIREIASAVSASSRLQPLSPITTQSEDDLKAFEVKKEVAAFANSAATFVVLQESPNTTRPSSTSGPPHPTGSFSWEQITLRRDQLECEWDANRVDFERLMSYGLHESAVVLQHQAMAIQERLAVDRDAWKESGQYRDMREQLADILIQCDTEDSKAEAIVILQTLAGFSSPRQQHLTSADSPSSPPSLSRPTPKELSIQSKLGRLYKERGQMDTALKSLNEVFTAYTDEEPKDIPKITEIGECLLEVYTSRIEHGDARQRAVSISQRKGFMKELERAIGQPYQQKATCAQALRWCEEKGIPLAGPGQDCRFDIMDEDGKSSPLHRAAEICHDEIVLRQMIENSDTLENVNEDHETPLLLATASSNLPAVRLLLQNKADVKACDHEGQSPLHKSQDPAVTKLLLGDRLRRSSATTVGSSSTRYPADWDLDINAQDMYKRTALHTACNAGQEKIVKLLLSAQADPNIPRYSQSPLAAAIESKAERYSGTHGRQRRISVVAALLQADADPETGKAVLRDRNSRKLPEDRMLLKALEGRAEVSSLFSPSIRSFEAGESSSSRGSDDQSSTSLMSLQLPSLESISLDDFSSMEISRSES